MDERLYINGLLIDLPERSISRTLQVNDFRELKDRQANYSNNIKIPLNSNNLEVLENLGMVGSTTRLPYQQVSVRYALNGIELISNGKGVLKKTQGEECNLVIYDGNISLSDLLGSAKIKDLDFSAYNHNLTSTIYLDSFAHTWNDGYIYATNQGVSNVVLNTVPCFFIKKLFLMIFEQNNWSATGDFLNLPEFEDRVTSVEVGYPKDTTGVDTEVYNQVNTNSRLGGVSTETIVDSYTTTSSGSYNVNVSGSIQITFGSVKLQIKRNGSFVDEIDVVDSVAFSLDYTMFVADGGLIEVVEVITALPSGFGGNGPVKYDFTENFTTIMVLSGSNVFINFNDLFGETTQISFLKDVMQRFNLSFRKLPNQNTIEFIQSEVLLSDFANAEDWSGIFSRKLSEEYASSYAQENNFRYKYDEDDQSFADGILSVDDVNLKVGSDLVLSIFKATQKKGSLGYLTNYWNVEGEPIQDGLRIFKIKKNGSAVTFNFRFKETDGNTSTTIDFAFWDFNGLEFQEEINNNYVIFEKFLNDYKIIVSEVDLDVIDIYNLDFFRLKYVKQLGRYFYLNKVISFKTKKVTKVELIQIPI